MRKKKTTTTTIMMTMRQWLVTGGDFGTAIVVAVASVAAAVDVIINKHRVSGFATHFIRLTVQVYYNYN